MAPSSSTSNSDSGSDSPDLQKLGFLKSGILRWLIVLAAAWAAYYLCAERASVFLANKLENQLIALGKGRILSPLEFVEHRALDAIYLLTVLIGLIILISVASRGLVNRVNRTWLWLPLSLMWFVGLNLFVALAGNTGLWWMAVHAAHPNLQQSGFNIERILLRESPSKIKVVVVGSSQGLSELNSGVLSHALAPDVRFGNMSFPGSQANDFELIREHYQDIDPEIVVCYVSQLNLYQRATGSRWTPLLSAAALKRDWNSTIWDVGDRERLWSGVLGISMPLYQQRNALGLVVYGQIAETGFSREVASATRKSGPITEALFVNQRTIDTALKDYGIPEKIAIESLPGVNNRNKEDHEKEILARQKTLYRENLLYQKQSLESFVEANQRQNRKVILIEGQVHPQLAASLPPGTNDEFRETIQELETKHPDLIVLRDELTPHTAADYDDLYHIKPEVRAANSKRLATILAKKFGWKLANETEGESQEN